MAAQSAFWSWVQAVGQGQTRFSSRPRGRSRVFAAWLWVVCGPLLVWSSRDLDAAAPLNDTCAGLASAHIIPGSGSFPYFTPPVNLTEATTVGDPVPPCQTNVTRGVWYRFTPSVSGLYQISTCQDSGTVTTEPDTVLAIYQSALCSGPFTLVACEDDQCGYQAEVLAQLTGGIRYYLLVWQFQENLPSAGLVQLRIDLLRPPPNDTCATAQELFLNIPVEGSTVLAQNDSELEAAACFGGLGQTVSTATGGEVVYFFTAPQAGAYSFKAAGYGSGNLVLYVAGSCPPASMADCLGAANRSRSSTAEEVAQLPLASNKTVYIFVDQDVPTPGSKFWVTVSRFGFEAEPNNLPAEANLLAVGIGGSVGGPGDRDVFALGATGPEERIFAMVDGESANMTDFELRITTATDVLEYDDADNDYYFGNFSPNVAGTPLPGGPVYIMISYNDNAPPGFAGSEPYRLYAVVQPPLALATTEAEPNELLVTASRGLNNYFLGYLDPPGPSSDVDLYAFEVAAGDLLLLGLDSDPLRNATPMDAKLALVDASGEVVLESDDPNYLSDTNQTIYLMDAFSPRSPGESLAWRAERAGTYYARVSIGSLAGSAEGAGFYLLSISRNGLAGSADHQDPPAFRSLQRLPDRSVLLSLAGTPGASYRVEASSDLASWTTVGVATADATGQFSLTDQPWPPRGSRFYRALWP